MKISCILKTRGIPEDKKKAEWFWQSVKSARCFDEVIIHTDTPEDAKALEPFATKVISQKASVAEGFNLAAELATGDFLTLLCDDDYYNQEHVDIFRKMVKTNPALGTVPAVVYFPYYILDENEIQGVHIPPHQFSADTLVNYNFMSPASFIRRSCWKKLGGYREVPHCDWDLWARAFHIQSTFAYIHVPIYYQRFYPTSNYQKTKFTPQQEREIIVRSLYGIDPVLK